MNRQPSKEALNAYYAEADSWANDKRASLKRSRRIAWLVAGAASLIAVCEAFALITLMPLKTVEPYTLMVDRQTGYVQLLKPLQPEQISGDRALTQSFLVQYVIGREGFDIATLDNDYRKVALWSAETARSEYIAHMPVASADSPLVRYPRSTIIETRVKSVTATGANSAMVRFETWRRDAGAEAKRDGAWVAMIQYRYSGEPMKVEDRFINPLGFQVIRYRRSAEVLPPEPETPTGPSAGAPQTNLIIPGRAPGAPVPRVAPPAAAKSIEPEL